MKYRQPTNPHGPGLGAGLAVPQEGIRPYERRNRSIEELPEPNAASFNDATLSVYSYENRHNEYAKAMDTIKSRW